MTTILFISRNEKKVVGKLKNKINILETLYNINTKSGDLVSELNPHSLIISTETLIKKTTLVDFLTQLKNNRLKIIIIGADDSISDISNIEQYENWSDFFGNTHLLKNKDDNIEIQIPHNHQKKNHSIKSIISLISITTICALLCFAAIFITKNKNTTNDIVVDETSSMSESQNAAHTSHEASESISTSNELTNSENRPVLSKISSIETISSKIAESITASDITSSEPAESTLLEDNTSNTTSQEEQPQEILPTDITLNSTSLSLTVGESTSLTATLTPSNATNKTVKWTSSNTSVATVSNGKVTAKAAGTTTIVAQTSNGIAVKCTVTVKEKNIEPPKEIIPTSIKVSSSSLSLTVGESTSLTATVTPSNATNKTVKWTSSNTSVATVSNGKVTAKAAGTTTIIAQTSNGIKAVCTVKVKAKPAAGSKPQEPTSSSNTNIYLSTNELTLKVGETKNIYAYNAEYGIKVSNTNRAIASISTSSISSVTVTANAVGTVTLTFTSKYDNSTAICKIYVLPYEE